MRNAFNHLSTLLKQFPVVAIIGARQVGKTNLAKEIAGDFTYMDLEKPSDFDRITRDPEFFFKQYPSRVIFDEAQECPELFPVLRGVIDHNRKEKGRYILTGSSSPEFLENISESLAGRIGVFQLGTLKANEIYRKPLSPFYDLFHEKLSKKSFSLLNEPLLSFNELQGAWLKGGYPEVITEADKLYHEWMSQYTLSYIQRDIAKLFPGLDRIAYRRFVSMLGKLSGQIINRSDLARSIGVTEPTIRHYLDIASGTFLWRKIPSFENNITKSVLKMPKGYLRDTGILHHLLRINHLEDLRSDPIAGFSFEAFVMEELIKGLEANGCNNFDFYYYRTRGGAEIDLILEGTFGLIPIEIKYSTTILGRQLRSMTDFIKTQGSPLGIVFNCSEKIEWLTENIIKIPVGFI